MNQMRINWELTVILEMNFTMHQGGEVFVVADDKQEMVSVTTPNTCLRTALTSGGRT